METFSHPARPCAVSEMAIVDTFTRLIFSDIEGGFDAGEQNTIAAFRHVDANVLMDTYAEMGEYLRSLGVREMIHLVPRIREDLEQSAAAGGISAPSEGIPSSLKRIR